MLSGGFFVREKPPSTRPVRAGQSENRSGSLTHQREEKWNAIEGEDERDSWSVQSRVASVDIVAFAAWTGRSGCGAVLLVESPLGGICRLRNLRRRSGKQDQLQQQRIGGVRESDGADPHCAGFF